MLRTVMLVVGVLFGFAIAQAYAEVAVTIKAADGIVLEQFACEAGILKAYELKSRLARWTLSSTPDNKYVLEEAGEVHVISERFALGDTQRKIVRVEPACANLALELLSQGGQCKERICVFEQ